MALSDRKLTASEVEAYFQALWDIQLVLGIQDGHCKSYDPLTIDGDTAHTYVFDLWDGGRHHHFESLRQLMDHALRETAIAIRGENWKETFYGKELNDRTKPIKSWEELKAKNLPYA